MSSPIIQLEQGKLKGKIKVASNNIHYYAFKGIPYAKPPIGELRFAVSTLENKTKKF